MARYQDTTVRVYGPYVAVKLPITKGVKMGNPIQLALGPRDLLFASNQTGEIYTLHDHDGDGLARSCRCDDTDSAKSQCKLKSAHDSDTLHTNGPTRLVACAGRAS